MASLLLGAVGGFMFGPIGFMAGSLLGNLLFPGKQEGPRLSNLKLQGSSYGQMIPIGYGTIRLAGQVVWQTDLHEHEHTSGGKGGPQVTTFSYTASFAVKICKGPIAGILTVWANGEVIWDTTGNFPNVDNGAVPMTIYTGVETALPDPTMEADLGVGNVPAFRDDAAVVFNEWDLGNWGNTLPQLSFLIFTVGGQPSPIFKLHEFHDNPPHEWCYAAIPGGDIGTQFPYITHWSLDNTDIRVRSYPSTDVRTYANPSYIEGAVDAGADDPVVAPVSAPGANFGWSPIGNYVYANSSTTPLWISESLTSVIGSSTTDCAFGSGSVATSGGHVTTSKNFANDAGVPAAEFCASGAATLSQDGKTLLVLTAGSALAHPTKWYRIVDGTVASSGTCASGLNTIGIGPSPLKFTSGGGGQATFNVNILENNGQYLWCYTANNSYNPKIGGPTYSGNVGWITLFQIDPNTGILDWLSTAAACPMTNPNETGIPYAAICSPADGYAGVIQGSSMALFSRISGAGVVQLKDIVSDVSVRSGLSTSDIDVTQLTQIVDGFLITTRADARTDLDPLRAAYFFDAVEQGGKAVFVNRGSQPIVTIPDNDLAAQEPNQTPPPLIELDRAQEIDLPASVNVTYINKDAAYQNGSQQAIRQTVLAQSVADVQLAIAMADQQGRAIANVNLYGTWVERTTGKLLTSRKYLYLEPSDVISAGGITWRIDKKSSTVPGIVEFDCKESNPAIYTVGLAAAPTSGAQQPSATATQPTTLVILDIPLVTDNDPPTIAYAAMAGSVDTTWRGAGLFKSSDGGANYTQIASSQGTSVIGRVATPLGNFGGGNMFDESNSFSVAIGPGGGTLSSTNELAVLNGANICVVGRELVQFKNANLTAPLTYTISGLLRGRRGTEWAIGTHAANETFVMLPTNQAPIAIPTDLGQSRLYEAVTNGQTLANTQAVPFTDSGIILLPYSPTDIGGGPDGSGNVTINWTRRTRIGGQWLDLVDVPLSEPTEAYVVQIWDSTFTNVARIIQTTSPTCVYSAANQTTDFGSTQQHIYCTIGQLGAYGLGRQQTGIIPGSGGSDTSVLSPIQPYGAPPAQGGSMCPAPVQMDTVTWSGSENDLTLNPFSAGTTWQVKFMTNSNVGRAQLYLVEFGGPPAHYNAQLSTSPCGAPIPFTVFSSDPAVSFSMWNGAGNPHPKQQPTLAINTAYYFTVTTSWDTAVKLGLTGT